MTDTGAGTGARAAAGAGAEAGAETGNLRVLQLATTARPFFEDQVRALEARRVECTTLTVPGDGRDRGLAEYLAFWRDVLREARDGYDLVHANYGLVGPFALAQPVRPVVLTLWGSDLMGEAGWLARLSRGVARASDAVVVPSTALSRELPAPHRVVPFGVDTDLFRPVDRQRARERVDWDPDGRYVLFPYDPDRTVKNYDLARRVVDRLPVEATLRTVSGVPHEEMPDYLNASDALLVTSERESGPMVVREALACEVPVVSTDVGFVAETVAGVENAHVATTERELVDRLASVLRSGRRAPGRDAVADLDLDRMAGQLVDAYDAALSDY